MEDGILSMEKLKLKSNIIQKPTLIGEESGKFSYPKTELRFVE